MSQGSRCAAERRSKSPSAQTTVIDMFLTGRWRLVVVYFYSARQVNSIILGTLKKASAAASSGYWLGPPLRFEGAPSGGFTATVCPPPDVSGPPSNEMFGRTPYERPRFARSTRSFIILTNGAHSSESFVTWPTNFGEFDPDGANLQSSCAARKPRPFIISGSDRRKPEVNRS